MSEIKINVKMTTLFFPFNMSKCICYETNFEKTAENLEYVLQFASFIYFCLSVTLPVMQSICSFLTYLEDIQVSTYLLKAKSTPVL